ncbi:MAG TPA: nuclear transport factor 2 family protein [Rhodanobacteraceae bacterium]
MTTKRYALAADPQQLAMLIVARANAGDADGMAALYEQDAVLVTGAATVARGRTQIRAFWANAIAQGRKFTTGHQRPAVVSGDLALTSTRFEDGRTTAEVARRQPDGSWRWVVDQPTIAE